MSRPKNADGTTPRPWQTMNNGKPRTLFHVETAFDNPRGAGVAIFSVPKALAADAELIVRAVNAHDDLIAACEALLAVRWDIGMHDSGGKVMHRFDGDGAATGCKWCIAKAGARAVIAKARGQ